jgi:threonine dehydrogenase-like Zn-dependent dehydrogenase
MRGVYCDGRTIRLLQNLHDPIVKNERFRIVRVRIAGICDTDLQLARGYMSYQGILGHEFVGELENGERVTAEINNACGTCPACLAGNRTHCPDRTVMGIFRHDGAMADAVLVQTDNLHVIPDHLDDLDAVFIEPLAAAFRVPEQVPLDAGTSVAILGDGKLGLLCAWVARLAGARASLFGRHAEKLELAGDDIATHLVTNECPQDVRFDVVIDATGSPSGLSSALRLVRPCGTVVLKTTVAAEHSLDLAPVVINEIRVIGSRCGPFPKAIAALSDRRIDVRPLIGAVYSLDDAETAFRAAAEKGAKKVILNVGS